MYKVFVNDKPIFLTDKKVEREGTPCIRMKDADIPKIVDKLSKGIWDQVYLYHRNSENLLQKFKKKTEVVIAAGGVVYNTEGALLFIKRNGKWDLPKGRVEGGEKLENAAIRETEEETGVAQLEIVKPLTVTYHFFNRQGKIKLKETYWFEMVTDFQGDLTPQTNEGIKKAVWKMPEKWKKTLNNSYANIRELFDI